MVADRAAVSQLAVQPSTQPGLRRGGLRGSAERTDPDRRTQGAGEGRRSGANAGQPALGRDRPDVGERVVEVVVHLDLAGDVGLRGPELARVPDQPSDRVLGAQLDQGGVLGTGLGAVPGAQPNGQVAADEGPQGRLELLRDPLGSLWSERSGGVSTSLDR